MQTFNNEDEMEGMVNGGMVGSLPSVIQDGRRI
jgi:hypothetical protein